MFGTDGISIVKDVTQALNDFVNLFEELSVPYAVMGGIAVRYFGIPRPTYDVDFLAVIGRDELPRLYQAAEASGYTVPEPFLAGWIDIVGGMPLIRIELFDGDESVDIDVFLAECEYQREIIRRRQRELMEGREVWLVSPEDLILLKLMSFRPRDHADIGDIRFSQGQLDEDYMRTWADRIGVRALLEQVLAESPI